MTTFLLLLQLLTVIPPGQQWNEVSTVGVPLDNGKDALALSVWMSGADPASNVPAQPIMAGNWHTIDLDDVPWLSLPADIKAIDLQGITGSSGLYGYYCGMVANFRAPGSTLNQWAYQVQAVAGLPGAAYRQPMTVRVPVVDHKFEFFWYQPHPECSFFINLSIQGYYR